MVLNFLKKSTSCLFVMLFALCIGLPSISIAQNNAVIGTQTVVTDMVAGESYALTMSFKNTGTTSWTSAGKYCGRLLNPTGWAYTSRCVAATVAKNGFLYLNATIVAPSTPGVYNYQWQMEQQGVGTFGTPSNNFVITVAPRTLSAQFVTHNVPAFLNAGTRAISYTMKNTGNVTWKAGEYALIAQNPEGNAVWGLDRLSLTTASVQPGGNGAFTGTITAPATLGNYSMQWRPMEVGKGYIGDATPLLTVPIAGAAPTVVVESPTEGHVFIGNGGFIDVPVKVRATPSGVAAISKIEILIYSSSSQGYVELAQADGPVYEGTLRRTAADQVLLARVTDSFKKITQAQIKIDTIVDNSQLVSHTIPTKMVPGVEYDVTATFKNTGGTTWTPANVELVSQNPVRNTTYGISAMSLDTTVPPGGTGVFSGRITAPTSEGVVQTIWRMFEKTRSHFGSSVLVSPTIARELPTAVMTTPVQGEVFEPDTGTTIPVLVEGSAKAGLNASISKLEIVEGAIVHATVNGTTISKQIVLSAGNHPLRLKATDNWGEIGYSPISTISVKANNADFVSQSATTTLKTGQVMNYLVTMRNSGSKPWSAEMGYALAVPDDKVAENWGMPHATPAATVAPGGQTTISIAIAAPMKPGTYDLQFRLLEGGREWFGEPSLMRQIVVKPELPTVGALSMPQAGEKFIAVAGKAEVRVQGRITAATNARIAKLEILNTSNTVLATVEGDTIDLVLSLAAGSHALRMRATDDYGQVVISATPTAFMVVANNASYVSATTPTGMTGRQKYRTTVNMKNIGTSTWTNEDGFMLAGISPLVADLRVALPGPVAPMGTAVFEFDIEAPYDPGTYSYQWQMIRESIGELFGAKSPILNGTVTSAAPPEILIHLPKTGDSFVAANGTALVQVFIWGKTYGAATLVKTELLDGAKVIATSTTPLSNPIVALAPGLHNLQARIIDSRGGTVLGNVVTVTVIDNGATFIDQVVPSNMVAGERYPVSVKVRNTGQVAWQSGQIVLRAQNPIDNATWSSTGKVDLSTTVAPGADYTFAFDVVAPTKAGTYDFQWRVENDKKEGLSSVTPNVAVTVGAAPVPRIAFKAAPNNVRVAPGQSATISLTGSATVQGGQISKLEVFKDAGAGYHATPIKVVNGPAAELKLEAPITLSGGAYRLKMRATDSGNRTAESEPVFVNVADSPLLGQISGVRTNGDQQLQLVGWACRSMSAEALAFEVAVHSPPSLGGVVVSSGIADISTEASDGIVRNACRTPETSHQFVVDISTIATQYPAAKLYVQARAANGDTVVLPCEDNSCRMPEGMRIGLTSPNADNNDRFRQPAPVFLRAMVSGYNGGLDEVAFNVNGEWIPAVSEGGGAYSASKIDLAPSATPYIAFAKVRQGGTTLITGERQFYVVAGLVPGTVSPTTGTVVRQGQAIALSTDIHEEVPAGYSVKFYISKVNMPAPLDMGDEAPPGGGATLIGTAINVGFKWSYSWTPTQAGFYEVTAKLMDGAGVVIMETPAVTLSVSGAGDDNGGMTDVAVPLPQFSGAVGGTLSGDLNVSGNGAASYSIPIVVPPGTAGLQPNISLNYNSQGTNGPLGLGWSLGGMSSIHRCGKTIAQDKVNARIDFSEADRLCLDGQRLVLVNFPDTDANYWKSGAEFRTEVETFSRITMTVSGGYRSFKVEAKDGRIMQYGQTTNSTSRSTVVAVVGSVNAGTSVCGVNTSSCVPSAKPDALSWALERIEDRSHNYIAFNYTQNLTTGEHLPKSVNYGGNGLPSHAAVVFNYASDRPDAWTRYIDQARNDLRSRLTSIETFVGANLDNGTASARKVRQYDLAYEQSPTSGRSMLSQVQGCARNPLNGAQECLPATTFTWGKPALGVTPGFAFVKTFSKEQLPILTTHHNGYLGYAYRPEYFAMADFENHGLTDILEKRVSGGIGADEVLNNSIPINTKRPHYRYFHNKGGDFEQYFYKLSTGENFVVLQIGDFNGDGAPDLLVAVDEGAGPGKSRICMSPLAQNNALGAPGSMITFDCSNSLQSVGANVHHAQPYVADVVGNGKSAIYSPIYAGDNMYQYYAELCIEGVCKRDDYPPFGVLQLGFADAGQLSPDPEGSFIDFSQMVDFGGTGKSAEVRWSKHQWVGGTPSGEGPGLEVNRWFNSIPSISVHGFKPSAESAHAPGGLSTYTYIDKGYKVCDRPECEHRERYKFDKPAPGQSVAADFNGSGYSSLLFGFRDRSPTYAGNEPWFDNAEMTLCLSTGREFDCKVRRKYSGLNYKEVRAVDNFVGDGAPGILVGDVSPQMCRVYGDDTTAGNGANDTNMVCSPWAGSVPAVIEHQEQWMTEKVLFLDILGTGRTQMVVYRPGRFVNTTWVENGTWDVYEPTDVAEPHQALDRIVKVTNGVGVVSKVEYEDGIRSGLVTKSGTGNVNYPLRLTGGVGKYASRVTVQHGAGLATLAHRTYKYQDPVTDLEGRGSMGFGQFIVTDELTGIETKTSNHLKWPLAGMAHTVVTSLNGTVLSTATSRLADHPIHYLSPQNGNSTHFVANLGGTVQRYDLNGKDIGKTVTTGHNTPDITYDNWGNAQGVGVAVSGGGQSLLFISQTSNKYRAPDITNWLIGLIESTSTTKKQIPGSTFVSRKVAYEYDAKSGKLATETVQPDDQSLSLKTTYDRGTGEDADPFGNVRKKWLTWHDPDSKAEIRRLQAEMIYDGNGRFVTKAINARRHAESRAHDAGTGTPLMLTGPNGLSTVWEIDGFGNVSRELRADGNETTIAIHRCASDCPANAAVVKITDQKHGAARISVPKVEYIDGPGRVVRSMSWGFDGKAIVVDARYDDVNRVSEEDQPRFMTDAAMLSVRKEQDVLGRSTMVRTLDDKGEAANTRTVYDGLITTITNPNDQTRTELRDVVGKIRVVTDALGHDTKFDYDAWGNLSQTIDPNENVITVGYDALGRKINLNDPDLGLIEYFVNPLGLTWKQISPNQRNKSQTIFRFDVLNRMVARIESDLNSYWVYDQPQDISCLANNSCNEVPVPVCQNTKSCGQLIETFTGSPTVTDYHRFHTYDQFGRPAETKQLINNTVFRSTPTYNEWGRAVAQIYQRGEDTPKVFSNRYNAFGYLSRVERGALILWEATKLDAQARVREALLGNGLKHTRDYSAGSGRLEHGRLEPASTGFRLQEDYTYDKIGNVLTRSHYWDQPGHIEIFEYDQLNRLKSSQVTGKTKQIFTYDNVGNLLSKTDVGQYRYRLLGDNENLRPHAVKEIVGNPVPFTYDHNGNLLSDPWRAATWTSFDMPLTIRKGPSESTFLYGSEHQRTRQVRVDNGITTTITYAGAQEVEEKNGEATVKTYWPAGLGVEIDRPGATQSELNWTHVDRLGSVFGMTKADGTFRERLGYDAWGKRRDLDTVSNDDSVDGKTDNKGFTGHEMLDQLDLVHMNGRVYDPRLGRFMSGDPFIQDPLNGQNYNRYTYVYNNPTNLTDPTGFQVGKLADDKEEKKIEEQYRQTVRDGCSGSMDNLCTTNTRSATTQLLEKLGLSVTGFVRSFTAATVTNSSGTVNTSSKNSASNGVVDFITGAAKQAYNDASSTQRLVNPVSGLINDAAGLPRELDIKDGEKAGAIAAMIGMAVVTRGESAGAVIEQQAAARLAAKLSKDPGLAEFVEKLVAGGVKVQGVNVNIYGAGGKIVGEIDVVTKNALIQYKNGVSSANAVLTQVLDRTLPHVDRTVITFINDATRAGQRTVDAVSRRGQLITNKIEDLIGAIK